MKVRMGLRILELRTDHRGMWRSLLCELTFFSFCWISLLSSFGILAISSPLFFHSYFWSSCCWEKGSSSAIRPATPPPQF